MISILILYGHCKSCLNRVYPVCLWKYDIADPILVDLTSNFFVLCTNMNVYLYNYIHSGWSLAWMGWRRETCLSPPVKIFLTDCSKAKLLLWIIFAIYVSCLSCFPVCSLQPRGHLLVKSWPLSALVCDVLLCYCLFPVWCPGSGVALDCIDSWSLTPY